MGFTTLRRSKKGGAVVLGCSEVSQFNHGLDQVCLPRKPEMSRDEFNDKLCVDLECRRAEVFSGPVFFEAEGRPQKARRDLLYHVVE